MFQIIMKSMLIPGIRKRHGDQLAKTITAICDQGGYTPGFWSLVHGRPVWSDKTAVQAGVKLKYGHIKGYELFIPVEIGGSEVIKNQSGRFVTADANGRAEILDAATDCIGHLEHNEETTSATEGGDIGVLNIALDAVYRIPVDASSADYAITDKFDTCDIDVSTSIQGANLSTSDQDVVQVLDGDLVNSNWVDVRLNPLKMFVLGVA